MITFSTDGLEILAQIGAIIVTVAIISVPALYPRYSFFSIRGRNGLEQLQRLRHQEETIKAGYLSSGETGFNEVKTVAEQVYNVDASVTKIWFVIGDSPGDIGEFGGLDIKYGIGSNAAILGENRDGEFSIIHFEAWSPRRVFNLEFLHEGLESHAQSRSHYVMMVLAVIWGTLSLIIVF